MGGGGVQQGDLPVCVRERGGGGGGAEPSYIIILYVTSHLG